jgi:hypothetical protein
MEEVMHRRRRHTALLGTIALSLALPAAAAAQGIAQAVVSGVPPILQSPFIGDLERDYRTGRFNMHFNFTVRAAAGFRFRVSLEKDGKMLMETLSAPIVYEPGQYAYATFDGSPAIRFPGGSADRYQQLEKSLGAAVVRSNVLPEGRYLLRLEPEPLDLARGITTIPALVPFEVRFPEPAVPITPVADAMVVTPYPQFTWLHQLPPGVFPEFELLLVEVLPSQTPLQALRGNRPLARERVHAPTFVYSPEQLPLEPGRTYAWQLVTSATLQGHALPVRDEGRSEIRTFRYDPPGIMPPAPVAPDPAPPAAACAVPLPAAKTPAALDADALRGRTVRLGGFDLVLDEVTGSAANLSGRGTVRAPLLGASLRVAFSELAINEQLQAYAGRATALPDREGLLSDDLLTGFSGDAASLASNALDGVLAAVRDPARLVKGLVDAPTVGLPLGVEAPFGLGRAALAIVGAEFLPTGARANALLEVPLPEFGQALALGARGLCLGGESLAEGARLVLLRDLAAELGGGARLAFRAAAGEDGTYAIWGKDRLARLRIALDAEYPASWLIPVDESGKRLPGPATIGFRFDATDGEWIAEGRSGRLELAAAPGFIIQPGTVFFDNSTAANPAGMRFPDGYAGVTDGGWTGLYIPQASLQLPAALRTFKDPNKRIAASLNHLLVDDGGVSVAAQLSNLIAVGAGDLGGWGYDIASLGLEIRRSSLVSGTMKGGVRLPLGNTPVPYTATLSKAGDGLDFAFGINAPSSYSADLWAAKLSLSNASHVTVKGGAGGWSAAAQLHGQLTLGGNLKLEGGSALIPLDFAGIKFQGLGLSTAAPYVSGGTWSFASPQHALGGSADEGWSTEEGAAGEVRAAGEMDSAGEESAAVEASAGPPVAGVKGFPVAIRNLTVRQRGNDIGLTFDVNLNLPGAEKFFEARTGLGVWGQVGKAANQPVSASFKGVSLEKVEVAGELSGVFTLKGILEFYHNHGTFGNGIHGTIAATAIGVLGGEAEVRFGERAGVDYWFADLMVKTETAGMPIAPGIGLYGFGGGASYHMRRNLPTDAQMRDGTWKPTYAVDRNVTLEIRARTTLGTHPVPQLFNADVELGVSFRNTGGIHTLSMNGNGWLITGGVTDRSAHLAKGSVNSSFDFANKIYDTAVGASINLAGIISGGGTLRIHANAPANRYFLSIGDPQQDGNVGLTLGIAGLGLGTHSYLHAGTDVPAPAPLPKGAVGVLSGHALSVAEGGRGFLFGSRAGIDFDETFLVFYAKLNAGFGFDFALVQDVTCAETGRAAGIGGWYASGQAYAFLAAEVGIDVDLWFFSGRVHAFRVAGAAGLEGGTANPTWLRGAVNGSYSVLGGAVRGSATIPFKVGTMCTPIIDPGNPLDVLLAEIITDLKPAGKNASVFSEPAAAFSINLDEEFHLVDNAGNDRWFRLLTDGITLRKGGRSGPVVPAALKREQGGAVYKITPASALESKTSYHIVVTVRAEERVNGRWVPSLSDGRPIVLSREENFTTGLRPDKIKEGVAHTYPLDKQKYFLYRETSAGAIRMLESGNYNYDYLAQCEAKGCERVEIKARFIPLNGLFAGADTIETTARILPKYVSIALPTAQLRPEQSYLVQLVRKEIGGQPFLAINLEFLGLVNYKDQITKLASSGKLDLAKQQKLVNEMEKGTLTLQIRANTLDLTGVKPGERLLHHFTFRTSRFGLLSEKLAAASFAGPAVPVEKVNYVYRAQLKTPQEPFEDFDIKGYKKGGAQLLPPLVQIRAPFPISRDWVGKYVMTGLLIPLQFMHARDIVTGPYYGKIAEYRSTGWSGVETSFGAATITNNCGSYLSNVACSAVNRDLVIDWRWGNPAYADFFLFKLYAGLTLSREDYRERFSSAQLTTIRNAAQRDFAPPFNGSYDLEFRYLGWNGAPLSRLTTRSIYIGSQLQYLNATMTTTVQAVVTNNSLTTTIKK